MRVWNCGFKKAFFSAKFKTTCLLLFLESAVAKSFEPATS